MSASKLQMPSRNVQIFTRFLSLFLKQTFTMKRTAIYGTCDKIDYFIHTQCEFSLHINFEKTIITDELSIIR